MNLPFGGRRTGNGERGAGRRWFMGTIHVQTDLEVRSFRDPSLGSPRNTLNTRMGTTESREGAYSSVAFLDCWTWWSVNDVCMNFAGPGETGWMGVNAWLRPLRPWVRRAGIPALLGVMVLCARAVEVVPAEDSPLTSFLQTVQSQPIPDGSSTEDARRRVSAWSRFQDQDPIGWDWVVQDSSEKSGSDRAALPFSVTPPALVMRALSELGEDARHEHAEWEALRRALVPGADPRWSRLYKQACQKRRALRLRNLTKESARIVFVKRRTIRPSFFAYTEGQSDAQNERHFLPGSALCLIEVRGASTTVRTLLEDASGVLRDPAVSWDGRRIVFAWKRSLDEDDYHLYELDVASEQVRQLTFGRGFADYEPAFLPNGDLVFSSTRCVQTVDCWWTEVSNLYTCSPDGENLRRLTFDQVHAVFPSVLDDGRVIYTRWDYNDRGQIFPQALFQMNPDGTGQSEFYGNNSWFPTTIAHGRGIPGTEKVLAIFCGHHTTQAGKLGILDPALGRQEDQGAQLTAPRRATPAVRIDAYGQQGELFRYPYPISQSEFLVTYAPLGWGYRDGYFAIYWMDHEGHRELLAFDPDLPCHQPVPVDARPVPAPRSSQVDYRRTDATCYVQDVYRGPGLRGIERGTIDRLRVIALEFRAAGVGNNFSSGPGGGALVSTPIAVGNGSWDVKIVLGDAKIYADGSACFKVPARTPLYFQALDQRGHALQTMRSWTTLQPGENASCVGCHEAKNSSPPASVSRTSLAVRVGPQELTPFYGSARGFSFSQEIQPILDRHCIRCHNDRSQVLPVEARQTGRTSAPGRPGDPPPDEAAFSLLGKPVHDPTAKRFWSDSYLALTGARLDPRNRNQAVYAADPEGRLVRWIGSQSVPEPLPPSFAGATRSELIRLLGDGHQGVTLSREELDKIACWIDLLIPYCGDYAEAASWSEEEQAFYARFLQKRRAMEALEQQALQALSAAPY